MISGGDDAEAGEEERGGGESGRRGGVITELRAGAVFRAVLMHILLIESKFQRLHHKKLYFPM